MINTETNESKSPRSSSKALETRDSSGMLLLRFQNDLKKTGKSAHTVAAYRKDVQFFLEFCKINNIKIGEFSADFPEHWKSFLSEKGRVSQSGIRRSLMSIRTFTRFLISTKQITHSGILEIKSPKQPSHDLLILPAKKIKLLLKTLKNQSKTGDSKAIRDYTIVLLLCQYGLKVTELCDLVWGDLLPVFSHPQYVLRVKGEKERLLYTDASTFHALELLKAARISLGLSTQAEDSLWFGFQSQARFIQPVPLKRHSVKFILYELTHTILGFPYNAESMRNSCIRNWLESGMSKEKTAQLAGLNTVFSLDRFSLKGRKVRKPKRQMKG